MSETRTRVKICGITNAEDAQAAIAYGADALGFNFVPSTPRYIGENSQALAILLDLPPFVSRVAVCTQTDTVPAESLPYFDCIQYYAPGGQAGALPGQRHIPAFRIQDARSLDAIAAAIQDHRPHALLLDAYHPDKLGGSGATFDWELAREAKARFGLPVILAGGLTPENVAEALAAVQPFGVDVSSGVEAEPGRKDPAKLKAFLRAVRRFDSGSTFR
jgi:phosphoribosylanthranilate isomerase